MTESVPWRSYAAVGDSMTEGLADYNASGKPKGWADRLAQHLADRAGEPIRYANLAIRGRLLQPILDEQVAPALELKPDLVSFWGGGNDMLRPGADPDEMAADVEQAVIKFREAGADVLIGLGFDAKESPIIRLTRNRVAVYNILLTGIAAKHGARVIDNWNLACLRDWRFWHQDRIHLNSEGHQRVSQAALAALGLTPEDPTWAEPLPPAPQMTRRETLDWNVVWARDYLLPWLGRRVRNASSGVGRKCKHASYCEVAPAPTARSQR